MRARGRETTLEAEGARSSSVRVGVGPPPAALSPGGRARARSPNARTDPDDRSFRARQLRPLRDRAEVAGALERARHEFHVGNLYFNRKCTGALVGINPFGGFNMSGTDSKGGGPDYLLLFTQAKSIAEKL